MAGNAVRRKINRIRIAKEGGNLPLVIHRSVPKRKFGVECEVTPNLSTEDISKLILNVSGSHYVSHTNSWRQTVKNDYWDVKYDSTCGPPTNIKSHTAGWEIASYVASGIDDVNHIANVFDFLGQSGVLTNKNCGFHIHVDVSDFSYEDMSVLISNWLRIEYFIYQISGEHRINNKHCKSLFIKAYNNTIKNYKYNNVNKNNNNSYNFLNKLNLDSVADDMKFHVVGMNYLWRLVRPRCLDVHNNSEKKYSINLVWFVRSRKDKSHAKNTVELRTPAAILSGHYIKNWILFFLNFVDSVAAGYLKYQQRPFKPVKNLGELLMCAGLYSRMHRKIAGETKIHTFMFDEDLSNMIIWFVSSILDKCDLSASLDL